MCQKFYFIFKFCHCLDKPHLLQILGCTLYVIHIFFLEVKEKVTVLNTKCFEQLNFLPFSMRLYLDNSSFMCEEIM